MSMTLQQKVILGFSLTVTLFIAIGILTYQSFLKFVALTDQVRHTQQVEIELYEILAHIKDAESGQRGYLLTGSPRYLQTYQSGLGQIQGDIKALQSLLGPNTPQQKQFQAMIPLIQAKQNEIQESIDITKTKGLAAGIAIVRTDRGKDLMEQIRIQIYQLQTNERNKLVQREQTAITWAQQTLFFLTAASLMTMLLLITVYLLINREIQERQRKGESLEKKVDESSKVLREQQQRYRMVVEGVEDYAIFLLDTQGNISSWNQGAQATMGYTQEEILGLNFSKFFPASDSEPNHFKRRSDELLKIAAQEGKAIEEEALQKKNGSLFLADIVITPIFDEKGDLSGYSNITRDITERRQTELAILESEARFRTMADNAPVLIWMTDENGACSYFNQTWLQFTGKTLDQQVTEGRTQSIHPDDQEAYTQSYRHAFQTKIGFEIEYRLKRFDDVYRWMLDKGLPRFSEDRHFLGYIVSSIDITEQKQGQEALEQKVEERTNQLQTVNQELEAFSYSVSHDLRAPLRGIDGFSQILLETAADQLDDTSKRYLGKIRVETQRMGQLIDDMLTLSRINRGDIHRDRVNLSKLADEVISNLKELDPQRTNVFVEIQPGVVAEGDARLLRIVLQNLLGNAWKFTSKQPAAHIRFGQQELEGNTAYFVQDDGAGFDMKYVQKLFGPFQRLHGMNEFPGTGIGLATVQRIVHRHNGEVWANAEVEKGATFYFTLK